ncbi:MAG TPA: DNA internalization-related competence protein ComEC/Rec2 [Vicinamibacterales bacterium]
MRAVAAVPAIGLLAGAAAGLAIPIVPRTPVFLILSICLVVSICGWVLGRTRLLVAGVAGFFFVGAALLSIDAWRAAWRPTLRLAFDDLAPRERARAMAEGRNPPEDDEAFAVIEGALRADGTPGDNSVSLSIDVDTICGDFSPTRHCTPVSGGVVVTVVGSLAVARVDSWRAGRRVRLPAALHRPARYLDPGVPDAERALARHGTTLVGTTKSEALVELLARGSWADEALGATRAFSRRAINESVGRWSSRSAGIVAAIVIGDRGALEPDVQRQLQEAGTYHVIAISGGNIAILAGLIVGAFRIAGLLGRLAMAGSIALLIVYAALVGGGASVDRATLMAIVYFGARVLDHRSNPVNGLAFVAAVLVAWQPLSIVDPAFLLTFGATLAILTFAARIRHDRIPRRLRAAATMFLASVATEALLFPIGAAIFSRVTFAGLALNFFAIPLMAVAQVAGMIVVPLAALSRPAASAVGFVAHAGAAGLVWSAGLVRLAPFVTYRVAAPAFWACGAYYGAVAVAWACRRRARAIALAVSAAAAVWILAEPWTILAAHGDGRLHVTFIDVGQGDSAIVTFPRGTTLLVDAGGLAPSATFDIGDRVVAPVLREAGIRRLGYVALTHGDPDHIGGAAAIISEFRPREVWEGIPVPRFTPLTALRLQAQAAGIRWSNVRTGDHIVLDDVEVLVAHPETADWERQKVRNDDSIVLELRWREVSVVLTGDIGKAVERPLTTKLAAARLRVIKVPHHGSLTSSTEEFIRALHPNIAVVSVGRANHFGHPVPQVLERYRSAGAAIFRTDQDGAVTLDTDGSSLEVHSFAGHHVVAASDDHHEDTKGTKNQ